MEVVSVAEFGGRKEKGGIRGVRSTPLDTAKLNTARASITFLQKDLKEIALLYKQLFYPAKGSLARQCLKNFVLVL